MRFQNKHGIVAAAEHCGSSARLEALDFCLRKPSRRCFCCEISNREGARQWLFSALNSCHC